MPRVYERCPAEERFWTKVDFLSHAPCWVWAAGLRNGYGVFGVESGWVEYAHRYSYRSLIGPIPPGLQLDHLCRVLVCVNPAHLEAVPSRENSLRGVGACAQNFQKTHCKNGHPLALDNLYSHRPGRRDCKLCIQARQRQYANERRENIGRS